jgi:pSer/pThr/pTyr-binding forkhead associated (FHA) protein
MRDGLTRKLSTPERDGGFAAFREHWTATLVLVAGGAEGCEFALERPKTVIGRGPGADLCFEDDAMSRQHAAVAFVDSGFRVRDLSSTNGTRVNGAEVTAAELKHGDRVKLGEHVFELVLQERPAVPRTYVLPDA